MKRETLPVFSIIIPTYNRGYIIKRPIDSILSQTFQSWELIIVDDGSNDDTKAIVESYYDPRISYIWQKNEERSAARNHGIRLAKGEWICFQDSDDAYLPEHLEVLWQGIQNGPKNSVVRSGLILQNEAFQITKSNVTTPNKTDIFPWECITCCAFNRKFLKYINFDERFNNAEDLHFLLQVSQKYEMNVLPIHTVLVFHEKKRLPNNTERMSCIKCLDDILTWYHGEKLTYVKQRRIRQAIAMLGNITCGTILQSIMENLRSFIKFPSEYIATLIMIFREKL